MPWGHQIFIAVHYALCIPLMTDLLYVMQSMCACARIFIIFIHLPLSTHYTCMMKETEDASYMITGAHILAWSERKHMLDGQGEAGFSLKWPPQINQTLYAVTILCSVPGKP